ncbi:MAG: LPS assembly protein LptD [Hyphomonadaceae bacterium]|nr:LPS assembly protein LptD [Hyphomonadaceae bacterium]
MSRSGDLADRVANRAPFGWTVAAAALAVGAAPAVAQTAQETAAPVAEQTGTVLLEADEIINDDVAQTVTASGDVQIRYQGRTMRADTLVYDLNSGDITATGNVQVVAEDGSVTYAERVQADEAMNVGSARELRARLGGTSTLAAREAIRRGEDSELRNVIYTSCPICEDGEQPPTWSLRARRAVQDRESRTISYRGAVLEVLGVPLLYIPYIAHPDPSVGRSSGFLPPEIGRNRRLGAFYAQPYYWAISPSQDLTTTLRGHENVNPLIGLDYRKRFWSGSIQLETTLTQEQIFDSEGDTSGEDRLRYSAFGQGRFRISDHWDWGFGLERTYDDDYLRRYEIEGAGERHGPYVGQETRLISQLFAIGQSPNSYQSISAVSFQGLREDDTSDLLPLILPFAEAEHVVREPLLDGQVRLQANTAALAREDNPATAAIYEGNNARLSLSALWRKDTVFGPGILLSPFAQVRGDVFSVETSDESYESFSRGLGLAGAEISWPFLRQGERFDVVVEPVMMAAVATAEDPDPRIVNEDSLTFELDDSNLFRANAAPNYDLWEPGARVSTGVRATARAHSGQSASVMFGRRWRDESAAGFTGQNNLAGSSSDWVVAAQTDLGANFGAETRLRLEDETLAVQRIDVGVRGAIGRFSGNARYFSVDDSVQPDPTAPNAELSGSVGVDLARGWRVQAGVTRDLDSDINLRQDIRAIYEDDCTFLEISYTRSETQRGTIGPDEGVQIRIGLRSLGVFGGS